MISQRADVFCPYLVNVLQLEKKKKCTPVKFCRWLPKCFPSSQQVPYINYVVDDP